MDHIRDGWDDDDIDVEDGLSDEKNAITDDGVSNDKHLKASPNVTARNDDDATQGGQEGWEWEDDIDEAENAPTFLQDTFPEPHLNIAKEKLISYIEDLHSPALVKSLNEILNEECNNAEFALKLCRYFHQRENLREYTLDVEVPRMDYQIILSDELILTEPTEIRQHFAENPVDNLVDDMLLRSANQAILADVFPIITGPDKMIRIQFLANAVATKCRLVLDMRSSRHLQVDCAMTISIPSGGMPSQQNTKLDLAKFRLIIQFSPEPCSPFVNYHIDSIQPLVDVVLDEHKIQLASEAIDVNNLDTIEREWVSSNSYKLRDNFLESIMSTQTAAGLKSALLEIDGVVNVSSKLNLIKQHLILPSADEILNAENDLNESEDNSDPRLQDENKQNGENTLPKNRPNLTLQKNVPPPPPPPSCPPAPSSHGVDKPKPIIGGLLMSGFSRLAKVASTPDIGQVPPPPPPSVHQPIQIATNGDVGVLKPPSVAVREGFGDSKGLTGTNRLKDTHEVLYDEDEDGWSDDGLDEIDDNSDNEKNISKDFTIHREEEVDKGPTKVNVVPNLFENMDNDNLTPELRRERDYLLQKLAEISQLKIDPLNPSSYDRIPYDTESGIIPTRKRFVSRAEILKLREIQID